MFNARRNHIIELHFLGQYMLHLFRAIYVLLSHLLVCLHEQEFKYSVIIHLSMDPKLGEF